MVSFIKKNRERFVNSKELASFSVFLFIAAALWLISALSNTYEDEISVKVKYYNLPKEKTLYSALPQKLDMLVSATGFTLLKYKYETNLPVIKINLEKTILKEKGRYRISKSVLYNQIEKQLKNNIKIKKIYYFDYDLDLSNVSSKEVPVVPNVKITLEDQYHLSNQIATIPSNIKIYGKKSILDTINFVLTEKVELNSVKSDIRMPINIVQKKWYKTDNDKVELIINVEHITEKNLKIPVSVINAPDSIEIQLFPDVITINFTVGFSKFDLIKPDYFLAQVDYKKIDFDNKFVNIRLVRYPKDISNIRYYPKKAEYLIKKKK